jgi:ferredoxin, 2Fe-2S
MPVVRFTSPTGETREIEGTVGDSVMQTAVRNGVPGIVGDCGGVLACATCHVFVAEENLPRLSEISEFEEEMLCCTAVERAPNSRLSCQIVVSEELGDLSVTTPEFQE